MFAKSCSRCCALLLVVAMCTPAAATAAPKSAKEQMIATLNNAANKAFDAGDFARAADIYLDLWRQDSTQPLFLYNAARASHLGGQLDRAEDLYRQLLALPGLDQARLDKTRGYLVEVQRRKGERKAEEAAKVEAAGNYEAAAALWRDAFDLDPNRLGWLARAGRALHLAGKKADAAAAYKKYLDTAPKDAADRSDVERWGAELRSTGPDAAAPKTGGSPAAAHPAATSHTTPGVGQTGPAPGVHKAESGVPMTAWIALGGGALLVGGGAVLYMGAAADQDALQKDLDAAKTTVDGKAVWKLDYADVEARNATIGRNTTIGAVIGGAGVLAAGVGAWLAVTAPKAKLAAAPAPDLGGVRLAWRF